MVEVSDVNRGELVQRRQLHGPSTSSGCHRERKRQRGRAFRKVLEKGGRVAVREALYSQNAEIDFSGVTTGACNQVHIDLNTEIPVAYLAIKVNNGVDKTSRVKFSWLQITFTAPPRSALIDEAEPKGGGLGGKSSVGNTLSLKTKLGDFDVSVICTVYCSVGRFCGLLKHAEHVYILK